MEIEEQDAVLCSMDIELRFKDKLTKVHYNVFLTVTTYQKLMHDKNKAKMTIKKEFRTIGC